MRMDRIAASIALLESHARARVAKSLGVSPETLKEVSFTTLSASSTLADVCLAEDIFRQQCQMALLTD